MHSAMQLIYDGRWDWDQTVNNTINAVNVTESAHSDLQEALCIRRTRDTQSRRIVASGVLSRR